MPAINWALMLASIGLVLGFQSSSRLAAAYGVAVTTDMVFTTLLFAVIAWRRWRWHPALVIAVVVGLLVVDLAFWGANLPKIPHGGWFPLLVAAGFFAAMTTWKRGRQILMKRTRKRLLPVELFVQDIERKPPIRVQGTAAFMDSNAMGTPPALLHNLKHNWVLHERVILLTIITEEVPYVSKDKRYEIADLGQGMYRLKIHVGFAEDVNVPKLIGRCEIEGSRLDPMKISYFLGRERLISTKRPGMAMWREKLFVVMSRNAEGVTRYFHLPANRVIELGMQVEI